ncbi:MAG: SMP-30/gluconolactonase/LRE family protein [Candidatus Latescibacterota bacterium]|jgi:sugar lactone lactonase YvrE
MYEIEKLAEENAVVGEGPMWNADEEKLIWTDIQTGRLFAYDPAKGSNTQIHSGFNIGGLMQNKAGGYLCFIWDGVVLWKSDDEWVRIQPEEYEGELLRFNDVIAAPDGSAFAGTFYGDKPGKLYHFGKYGSVEIVEEGIGCANGMGFSPDLKTMYFTDAAAREIYAYDFDAETASTSNKRIFVKVGAEDGVPDGMTVDSEGYIWSANWFGACIIRFDPDGKEERRVATPAKQTSSVMFGGKDLDELYFTSAAFDCPPGSALDPLGYDWDTYQSSYRGGGLFCVKGLGIQGKAEYKADFSWPAS